MRQTIQFKRYHISNRHNIYFHHIQEDFSHVAGAGVQFLNISLLNLFNNNPLDIPHELQGRFPNDQIQIDLYHVKTEILIQAV